MTAGRGTRQPHPHSEAGRAVAAGVDITAYQNRHLMQPPAWEIDADYDPADGLADRIAGAVPDADGLADRIAAAATRPVLGDIDQGGGRGDRPTTVGDFRTATPKQLEAANRALGIRPW